MDLFRAIETRIQDDQVLGDSIGLLGGDTRMYVCAYMDDNECTVTLDIAGATQLRDWLNKWLEQTKEP